MPDTFDLDVALLLLGRLSREFGGVVTEFDTDHRGLTFFVDVPPWGRRAAGRVEMTDRNRNLTSRSVAHHQAAQNLLNESQRRASSARIVLESLSPAR